MSLARESFAHRRVRLGSVEPAVVTVLKLLDPLIVALTLFACEFLFRDPFTPALGAYATLAFIVTSVVFNRLEIHDARGTGPSISDFPAVTRAS